MAISNVPEATHFIDISDPDVNLGLGDFDDQRVFAVSNACFDRRKAGFFWSNKVCAKARAVQVDDADMVIDVPVRLTFESTSPTGHTAHS